MQSARPLSSKPSRASYSFLCLPGHREKRRKHKLVGLGNHHVLLILVIAICKLGLCPAPIGHLPMIVRPPRENRPIPSQKKHKRVSKRKRPHAIIQPRRAYADGLHASPTPYEKQQARDGFLRNRRALRIPFYAAPGTVRNAGNTNWSASVITTSFSSSSSPSASSAFVQLPSAIWP